MKVCSESGCPTLTEQSRCPTHTRQADKARGTRQQRGYDTAHDRLRRQWQPKVATGNVRCWRCRQLIHAHEPWDLGHDDHDRTIYRGPEHVACNRGARPRGTTCRPQQ